MITRLCQKSPDVMSLEKKVNIKLSHFALNFEQTTAGKKKKMTVMLALQRKVPYGSPSGPSVTYVTFKKKTYFYFSLSTFKQETQEISSKKGEILSFISPIKLTSGKVSED